MGAMNDIAQNGQAGLLGGAVLGTLQAAWDAKPQVQDSTLPQLRHTVSVIGSRTVMFGLIGMAFGMGKAAGSMIRGKDDSYNYVPAAMVGAAAAGATKGSLQLSVTMSLGLGAFFFAYAAMEKSVYPEDQASKKYFKKLQEQAEKMKEAQ
eukprot:Clim_evm55s253 gene=Clim_evmTU55s253